MRDLFREAGPASSSGVSQYTSCREDIAADVTVDLHMHKESMHPMHLLGDEISSFHIISIRPVAADKRSSWPDARLADIAKDI